MTSKSNFIFVVCQVGAEPALKKELAKEHPSLKFSYSRPGFLTFKQTEGEFASDFSLSSTFARAFGVSLGQIKSSELSKVLDFARESSREQEGRKFRLHVWERDFYPPGEEPLGFISGVLSGELERKIRLEEPALFADPGPAVLGDQVLDLIVIEKDQYWLGTHLHTAFHSPWPGARIPLLLPAEAPSRAYLKLEESLVWSGAPIHKGDIAVEIGSAPGGASFALLERGLKVIGIDPAEMDPKVLRHPGFWHFQQPVNAVLREDLPESIQWVLLDMNVEPRISLFAVDRLVSRMKESLLGVLLTMKLNQWKIADEIPDMLAHVRAMGMVRVKAAQLSHHRQEFIVYGLTRKGLTRNR